MNLKNRTRFALEFGFFKPPCGSSRPKPPEWWYTYIDNVHYLHFGIILFIITGIATVIISILTKPIPEENLYRLTFWSRRSAKVRVELDKGGDLKKDEGDPNLATMLSDTGRHTVFHNFICDLFHIVPAEEPVEVSLPRRVFNFLCGIKSGADKVNLERARREAEEEAEATAAAPKTKEELAKEAADFLYEPSGWKWQVSSGHLLSVCLLLLFSSFVDFNAILVMSVTFFCIGFFA